MSRIWELFNRFMEMVIGGCITKAAGDDDRNDIVDHETGEYK